MAYPLGLRRHGFVWLNRTSTGFLKDIDVRYRDCVADWIGQNRPFVVRRRSCVDPPTGIVPLGLALPLSQERRRIALHAPLPAIARHAAPPLLSETLQSVNTDLHTHLVDLSMAAKAAGLTFRVFGSLAWQALTGEQYLHAGSDVDLLASPASKSELARVLDVLSAWEARTGRTADGEILFRSGEAVAWHEIADSRAESFLVKTCEAVYLSKPDFIAEQLADR